MAIPKEFFVDNRKRVFVPYQGWLIEEEDGATRKDTMTQTIEGPLKSIPDPLGHGNYHTLENLLDRSGNKILPKGVRFIKFNPKGYYLAEDNNEDELLHRGDVPGGFSGKDYREKANIIFSDGRILSDEWFDKIYDYAKGYFKVNRNGKQNLIDCEGKFLLDSDIENILFYSSNAAYSIIDGCLQVHHGQGVSSVVKRLNRISGKDLYSIGYDPLESGLSLIARLSKRSSNLTLIMSGRTGLRNIIDRNGYLLFDNWYDDIRRPSLANSLFFVKDNCGWHSIDVLEQQILSDTYDHIFSLVESHTLIERSGRIGVIDSFANIIKDNYTSALWASGRIWNIQLLHNGEHTSFLFGQCKAGIAIYAQQVLTSGRGICFLEKDGTWYLLGYDGQLTPYFICDPLFIKGSK